ncbi:MAG: 3-keto-5-aminohexanoate cleavage protein [Casimicrobiaceae bacterium]
MSEQASLAVAIAVAPNGARRTRGDHPRLPLTPDELAQCAEDCLVAGASMMHLHVRDAAGRHSLEADDYRAAIDAIRWRVGADLVLQVTTESGGRYTPAQQIAHARELAPQALSLAVRELWSDPALEKEIAHFIAELVQRDALVQYIVYDENDMAGLVRLHADGVIAQAAPHVLLVLGSYAQRRAGRPAELPPLVARLPTAWPWSACAFGAAELRCVTMAALLGGHVRVGFENNLHLASGAIATDNAQLVRACREVIEHLGLRNASCAEMRRLFLDSREPAT